RAVAVSLHAALARRRDDRFPRRETARSPTTSVWSPGPLTVRPIHPDREASHHGSRDHRLTTTFVAGRARLAVGQLTVPFSPLVMRLSALQSSCTNLDDTLPGEH
ncbi:MAG: hypothetical protein ACP5QO_17790, partial [Clostridia bacterium]